MTEILLDELSLLRRSMRKRQFSLGSVIPRRQEIIDTLTQAAERADDPAMQRIAALVLKELEPREVKHDDPNLVRITMDPSIATPKFIAALKAIWGAFYFHKFYDQLQLQVGPIDKMAYSDPQYPSESGRLNVRVDFRDTRWISIERVETADGAYVEVSGRGNNSADAHAIAWQAQFIISELIERYQHAHAVVATASSRENPDAARLSVDRVSAMLAAPSEDPNRQMRIKQLLVAAAEYLNPGEEKRKFVSTLQSAPSDIDGQFEKLTHNGSFWAQAHYEPISNMIYRDFNPDPADPILEREYQKLFLELFSNPDERSSGGPFNARPFGPKRSFLLPGSPATLQVPHNILLGIFLSLVAGLVVEYAMSVLGFRPADFSRALFLLGVFIGTVVTVPSHEGGHYVFRDGPATLDWKTWWSHIGIKNVDGTGPSRRMAAAGPLMGLATVLLTPALYFTELGLSGVLGAATVIVLINLFAALSFKKGDGAYIWNVDAILETLVKITGMPGQIGAALPWGPAFVADPNQPRAGGDLSSSVLDPNSLLAAPHREQIEKK